LTHKMVDRYGFKKVGLTIRKSISADDNDWAGMFFDGKTFAFSKQYRMHIVDRVGGGDCFTAGLIYAMRENYSPEDTVEFAVAASCLKHAIEGDYAYLSAEEVWNLAKGSGNGRIQR
ncbi:MAG: PfkB family carbohydrate kinase, partial [Clostridia bacterium]|nr:PfkB family carbohydrate kinase [Clostridia bacterium]